MTKTFSFDSLDLTKKSENPVEFEYIDELGEKTGFFISVVGKYSQKVSDATTKETNRRRYKAARNAKRNTDDYVDVQDDIDYILLDSAARIVGWRVAKGTVPDYSEKAAVEMCRKNDILRGQVVEFSNNAGNFTKSK